MKIHDIFEKINENTTQIEQKLSKIWNQGLKNIDKNTIDNKIIKSQQKTINDKTWELPQFKHIIKIHKPKLQIGAIIACSNTIMKESAIYLSNTFNTMLKKLQIN